MSDVNIKLKLQELIDNSVALKSLPEKARKMRTEAMLNADDDTMKQFIAVLENEAKQVQAINDDMADKTQEINALLSEAKQLEQEAKRELRKEEENQERANEEKEAEDILKKLDEIENK